MRVRYLQQFRHCGVQLFDSETLEGAVVACFTPASHSRIAMLVAPACAYNEDCLRLASPS